MQLLLLLLIIASPTSSGAAYATATTAAGVCAVGAAAAAAMLLCKPCGGVTYRHCLFTSHAATSAIALAHLDLARCQHGIPRIARARLASE